MEAKNPILYEEFLELPVKAPDNVRGFALDIGASLTKLIYVVDRGEQDPSNKENKSGVCLRMLTFLSNNLEFVLKIINEEALPLSRDDVPIVSIGYGYGVVRSKKEINEGLGITIDYTDEFTCFTKGFYYLINNLPKDQVLYVDDDTSRTSLDEDEKYPLIFSFIGSAVIFLLVFEDGSSQILEGLPRGGLYYVSMNKMLLGTRRFREIMAKVDEGCYTNVDIVVDDVYGEAEPENCEVSWRNTLFPMGKIGTGEVTSPKPEDIADALFMTQLDDIRKSAILAIERTGVKSIYFGGSFVKGNQKLRDAMKSLPALAKKDNQELKVGFVKYEGYIGAIGAFLLGLEKLDNPNVMMTQIKLDDKGIVKMFEQAGVPMEQITMRTGQEAPK